MNIVVIFIILLFFLLLFYGLLIISYKYTTSKILSQSINKLELILLVFFIIGVAAWIFYLQPLPEKAVYYWDNAFYWIKTLNFSKNVFIYPFDTLKELYFSIDLTDYSDVVPCLMTIPFLIVGPSYRMFVFLIYIMFQLPSSLILAKIVTTIINKFFSNKRFLFLFSFIMVSSLPFLYLPTFFGLYDSAGLLISASIVLLLLEKDWTVFDLKYNIILSSLFLLLLTVRRHFSFFALTYFGWTLMVHLYYVLKEKNRTAMVYYIKNIGCIACICLLVLGLFFRTYLVRTLFNNYAFQYSAYSLGTLADKFINVSHWISWIVLIFCLLGIVFLFVQKMVHFIILFLTSSISCLLLFFRIQDLSMQHYYNIAVQVAVLYSLGIYLLFYILENYLKGTWKKVGQCFVSLILVICLGRGMIYVLDIDANIGNPYKLYSYGRFQPPIRKDIDVLEQIVEDAKKIAHERNTNVYVLASGEFNDDILRNLKLPEENNYFPELSTTYHMDLTLGFPEQFLTADAVITTNPVLLHANPDGQRMIKVLNEAMNSESELSNNFELVRSYNIDKGVTVFLYKKIRDFEDADYEWLINSFNQWYSDYPELFQDHIENVRNQSINIY